MACSRRVREAARRYWLLGYSDEKIIPLIKQDFPDEPTPARWHTIADWRKAENWPADLEVIDRKATAKRQEELATELAQMHARQLALLGLADSHVQLMLTARMVRDSNGRPIDTKLSASELSQIMSAFDKSVKNQRLIRNLPTTQSQIDSTVNMNLEMEKLSDEQLERLANGESPENVLANPSRS